MPSPGRTKTMQGPCNTMHHLHHQTRRRIARAPGVSTLAQARDRVNGLTLGRCRMAQDGSCAGLDHTARPYSFDDEGCSHDHVCAVRGIAGARA
jgi:hypothetical protein